MGKVIYKKKVGEITVQASFDDIVYSKEESNRLIAEFLFVLTAKESKNF